MVKATDNIIILSTQKIRASTIKGLLKKSLASDVNIAVTDPDAPIPSNESNSKYLIILDLMSVDLPAKQIISRIKKTHQNAGIIALHMYRSSMLVEPLFEFGVNGYVYYEPTREELTSAIISVSNGERYVPEYLLGT